MLLNEHESNYTSFELECLAVVDSVEKFDVYLHGSHFTVISDDSALQWLFKIKKPTGRLYRWSVRLSAYDYKVVHRQGKNQQHVDALSRAPITMLITTDLIKKAQQEDQMILTNRI
jgi:hypothetical protein